MKHFSELPLMEYLDQFKEINQGQGRIKSALNFSFWSSGIYKKCPKQYQGVVLEKRKGVVDQRASIEGTVLHSVMETFLRIGKPDWDWPNQVAVSSFETAVAGAERIGWKEPNPEEDRIVARELTKRMISRAAEYLRERDIFERYEIAPEQSFRVMVIPDLTITGRVDVWLKDKSTGVSEIVDWKGIKDPGRAKMEQMLFYGLGITAKTGILVGVGEFCCPQLEPIRKTCPIGEDSYKGFLHGLETLREHVTRSMAKNEFPKAPSGLCPWCPLYGPCESGSQGTVTELPFGGIRVTPFGS